MNQIRIPNPCVVVVVASETQRRPSSSLKFFILVELYHRSTENSETRSRESLRGPLLTHERSAKVSTSSSEPVMLR